MPDSHVYFVIAIAWFDSDQYHQVQEHLFLKGARASESVCDAAIQDLSTRRDVSSECFIEKRRDIAIASPSLGEKLRLTTCEPNGPTWCRLDTPAVLIVDNKWPSGVQWQQRSGTLARSFINLSHVSSRSKLAIIAAVSREYKRSNSFILHTHTQTLIQIQNVGRLVRLYAYLLACLSLLSLVR